MIARTRYLGHWALGGLMVAGLALGDGPVLAQSNDMQPLVNRLERLERDIQSLGRQVYRGESPPAVPAAPPPQDGGASAGGQNSSAYAARMSARVAQIEDELRQVTGNVEGINHQIRQVSNRLDKLVSDMDYRLSALERNRMGGAPSDDNGAGARPGGGSRSDVRPVTYRGASFASELPSR